MRECSEVCERSSVPFAILSFGQVERKAIYKSIWLSIQKCMKQPPLRVHANFHPRNNRWRRDMDRVQLKPSRSAPDLTDLLEARSYEDRRLNGTSEDVDDDEDEDDVGGNGSADGPHHRWRRNSHLPTPSPSRSPTPDLSHHNGVDYEHSMEDADTYSFRLRSETPEVYTRGNEREDSEGTPYLRRAYSSRLRQSQPTSDSEVVQHYEQEESASPRPSTPTTSSTRPRGLSNVGSRFLPASLWDYLQEEISASELDGSQETKAERVTNFFSVPMAVEKVSALGCFTEHGIILRVDCSCRSSSLVTLYAWTLFCTPSQSCPFDSQLPSSVG